LIFDFFKASGGSTPRSIFDEIIYDREINEALRVSKNSRQFLTKLVVILLKRRPGDFINEIDRLIKESSSISDLIIRVILENFVPHEFGDISEKVIAEVDDGTDEG
jgi:hypothetical protein